MAYNNRGNAWVAKKEYDKADRRLRRGHPPRPQVRRGLRQPRQRLVRQAGVRQGDRRLHEAIRLDPEYAAAYNDRGGAWYAKQEYDKAIADYNEAIRLDPKYAAAYHNRGNAWCARRSTTRRSPTTTRRSDLDPKFAVAYNNRGIAWNAKGEYDQAIADFDQAIRLDPKLAVAYFNRGLARNAKGEYDKAIADYDQAIRLDPKLAVAYLNRGLARNAKGEYDQAIADCDQAIRLDPKFAEAYNNRAWLWATCPDEKYRDGKKALESATRACELTDWKEAYHLDTLAAAYAECGDFAHAIEYQEKAQGLYKDEKDREKGRDRLALYREKKPYRDVPEAK